MVERRKKRRIRITRQTLPALSFVILGLLMMIMPFIVEHSGFKGDVLIASETLPEPFAQTLVLVGQETVDGAVGLILNKPLSDADHAKLSPFIRDTTIPVGYGGPIDLAEKLFVIQETRPETPTRKGRYIIQSWDNAVLGTPDLLDRIRDSLQKGEQKYRIVTGYTSWGPLALEEEVLLKDFWRPITAQHDLIFQVSPAASWDSLNKAGKPKPAVRLNQT